MDKIQVIQALQEMASLMEIESENPFRARSYTSAARALEAFTGDFGGLIEAEEGGLRSLRGVGDSIARVIEEIYHTGVSQRHVELLGSVPAGVRQMLQIPGMGPKKIRKIWRSLEVETLEGLAAACKEDRVAQLSGFGAKSQQKILQGIEYLHSVAGQYLIPEMEFHAAPLLRYLEEAPGLRRIALAGSLRRRKEVVKDLDILAASDDTEALTKHFLAYPPIGEVIGSGSTKTSVRLQGGVAVDLRIVSEDAFPSAWMYFTGSKEHNTALRARARESGFKLNEYGLFSAGEDSPIPLKSEEEVYSKLGLSWVPPELRENLGEIELAERGKLPELVVEDDVRGVIHLHTQYSDGKASLEEMAEAARQRGYSYIGVTDHSRSAFYAGGLEEDAIRRQHEEIDRLNAERSDFRIFKGIESDIRADGSLDYPPEILDLFDFVIASLHSAFQQPREEMTRRVLRALEDPHTTMLGHPTTRLLLRRGGVDIDMDRILVRAAELGVAIEINASPHRLDLDWRHGPRAAELGLLTSINPDAHSPEGIDDISYGVGIARKAGFEAARVVNTLGIEEFRNYLGRRRSD